MSKKIPDVITQMLAAVQSMPLSDVYHYGSLVCDAIDRRQRSWWGSDEQKAENEARNAKNTARKVSQAKLVAKRVAWAEANLRPGMIVKMAGTRDRHGVRYISDIVRGNVLCRQMSPTHRAGRTIEEMSAAYPNKTWIKMAIPGATTYSIWEVTNAGTDHGIDRVVGVFKPNDAGNLEYEAIK